MLGSAQRFLVARFMFRLMVKTLAGPFLFKDLIQGSPGVCRPAFLLSSCAFFALG
jgi:hypothetical protein